MQECSEIQGEIYVIKPHISAYNNSLELKFWRCSDADPKLYPKWTRACNRKNFKFGKNNFICSNHFKYRKPTLVSPNPTLFLKYQYSEEVSVLYKAGGLFRMCLLPMVA